LINIVELFKLIILLKYDIWKNYLIDLSYCLLILIINIIFNVDMCVYKYGVCVI